MEGCETIEEMYQRKFDWMPNNIGSDIGHFNLFRLEPPVEGKPKSIPYLDFIKTGQQ